MPSWFQRLRGNLFLAYCAAVSQPAKKWFRPSGLSGEQLFLANHAPEGNVVTTPEERALLLGAGRCIQCGLCDAYAPTAHPSLIPNSLTRAAPQLNPETLTAAEAICPTQVPLVALARLLKAKVAPQ